MAPAKLLATTEIDIDAIKVTDRLRPFSEASIESLMHSIEEIGLQAEIHVRKIRHRENRLFLIAGGHRIEAFRRLGRHKIACKVWDCTDDWATMAEIDDNLTHTNLVPLDEAVFLCERERVFYKIHPEKKQGIAGANARWNATDNLAVASFVTSTAAQMGQSERNVRRIVSAAKRLTNDHIEALRLAPARVTRSDLQTIAKLTSSADQDIVVKALSEGTAKSAAKALSDAKAKPGDALKSDADKKFTKLADAFARAPMAAKRRFVEEYGTQLAELMTDASEEAPTAFTTRRTA
ncbi:Nucleoid occlusion protein [Ascidiaceihabitans donghaensis]|uniref:Nucleoid occlusion protein n=1 Tax=Ascidiaceihabitans donghaensis TaxID=1510460 RepID=A0A2R8BD68_9RHOB|nr:ParB N-terminal domain-containing protein [Ascidiaceihabitans donghaensis]SPH21014.1 Nucleoid occlusion protein [Ascidiaceihabitans donghaensis]